MLATKDVVPAEKAGHLPPKQQHGMLSEIPLAPEDQMFGLSAAYRGDSSPDKVDLGVGAYRDHNAKPWILPSVKMADKALREQQDLNHEYLPIAGLQDYLRASQRLVLGSTSAAIEQQRVASMQSISGTGALHLGALFLARWFPDGPAKRVYVTNPPYANHLPILHHVSLETDFYPYYSPATKTLNLQGLLARLHNIPDHSIVLLHACAHNPTGVDPSRAQWRQIAAVMKAKNQLPYFDLAYQGFASGDVDDDAWAVRYFVEQNFEVVMISQSYAKNMGLYGERAGCLHIVTATAHLARRIGSQLEKLQRVEISTPPAYGARIASLILNDETIYAQWLRDLRTMSGRVADMRRALRGQLEKIGTPGQWNHITDQSGMFSFSGLAEAQVDKLRRLYHIYTTRDGRLSISGLNASNVDYVASAIKASISPSKL